MTGHYRKSSVFGPELEFTLVETGGSAFPFYIVFNSKIEISTAITKAYQLASEDPIVRGSKNILSL